jgi:hypothetical protein
LTLFFLIVLAKPLLQENPKIARSISIGVETERSLNPSNTPLKSKAENFDGAA